MHLSALLTAKDKQCFMIWGRNASIHGVSRNLEDQALVTLDASDALPVKILEQRYRIFAGKPRELFEASNIQQAAAKCSQLHGELIECAGMDEQVIAAHAHECLVAL